MEFLNVLRPFQPKPFYDGDGKHRKGRFCSRTDSAGARSKKWGETGKGR